MKLNKLTKLTTKKKKTIGRGYGSGKGGHTSTMGMKGQKSRSGAKFPRKVFEGGQNTLSRRIPKLRGFNRGYLKKRFDVVPVNVEELNIFKDGTEVTHDLLLAMVGEKSGVNRTVKVLGDGELEVKLHLKGIQVSKQAKEKIEKLGGTVEE